MGVILGNGRTVPPRYHKHYKIPFLGLPTCRMTIIVEYTDGTQQKFGSSEKWKITAEGPIRSNNEYDGEVYDARKDLANGAVWAMMTHHGRSRSVQPFLSVSFMDRLHQI